MNLIVTSRLRNETTLTFRRIDDALRLASSLGKSNVWFIGGAQVYAAAMPLVDVIDVTYVPDDIPADTPGAVLFPTIDESEFEAGAEVVHEDNPALTRHVWTRRGS